MRTKDARTHLFYYLSASFLLCTVNVLYLLRTLLPVLKYGSFSFLAENETKDCYCDLNKWHVVIVKIMEMKYKWAKIEKHSTRLGKKATFCRKVPKVLTVFFPKLQSGNVWKSVSNEMQTSKFQEKMGRAERIWEERPNVQITSERTEGTLVRRGEQQRQYEKCPSLPHPMSSISQKDETAKIDCWLDWIRRHLVN